MLSTSLRAILKAPVRKCRNIFARTPATTRVVPKPHAVWPDRNDATSPSTGHSDWTKPGFDPYRLLWECQEEITVRKRRPEPDFRDYYASAYRCDEAGYWQHIPSWMYEDFRERLTRGEALRCLDVGCAYGTLLLYAIKLLGCEPYAIDFIKYLEQSLIDDYGVHYLINNIEREVFPWQTRFDVILFTEVLEHLNFNAVPTLEKLRGLLAPGGRLYLSTPDALQWGRQTKYYARYSDLPMPQIGSQLPVIDDHVWQFDTDELIQLVVAAGFQVVRRDYAPGSGRRHLNLTLMAS